MLAQEVFTRLRHLPFTGLNELIGSGNILVLAPHPDDESLGCGGLIAAACMAGRPPEVLILTDGTGSHPSSVMYPAPRLRTVREKEAKDATQILGLPPDQLRFMGLPDTAAPTHGPAFQNAVEAIVAVMEVTGCRVVAAPCLWDPHCDHVAAHLMAKEAALHSGGRLLSYPTWVWTIPDTTELPIASVHGWRLDVTAHLPTKHKAIAAHASQCSDLIPDDPGGFRMPRNLLTAFEQPFEVFLAGS